MRRPIPVTPNTPLGSAGCSGWCSWVSWVSRCASARSALSSAVSPQTTALDRSNPRHSMHLPCSVRRLCTLRSRSHGTRICARSAPCVYPDEGPPTTGPRDLTSVLRARAQLQSVATPVVQELHDQVLDSAVTLIDLLRSHANPSRLGRAAIAGGNLSLSLSFETINHRVGLLERQMLSEFGYERRLPRGEIEMTGRALTPRGAPASSRVNRGVAYP